ncbi:hypothetical protein L6164_000763 [Bauhinia variegata]|uniref:Uncharacterized protein n=1 Tax=Bauhinia variegata TaxID=167791 RepID=A0ACB9Q8V7_BAUVA|nr:hypothetical protein L6164_000763 [Bauhinia variegata]
MHVILLILYGQDDHFCHHYLALLSGHSGRHLQPRRSGGPWDSPKPETLIDFMVRASSGSEMPTKESTYTRDDARTWLSAVMTNHRMCTDELKEKEYDDVGRNLTTLLAMVIALNDSS